MDPSHGEKPTEWMRSAGCLGVDPELMFPSRGEDFRRGKAVCVGCPVKARCLAYAMTPPVERFGIYGGMTSKERVQLRKRNRRWTS